MLVLLDPISDVQQKVGANKKRKLKWAVFNHAQITEHQISAIQSGHKKRRWGRQNGKRKEVRILLGRKSVGKMYLDFHFNAWMPWMLWKQKKTFSIELNTNLRSFAKSVELSQLKNTRKKLDRKWRAIGQSNRSTRKGEKVLIIIYIFLPNELFSRGKRLYFVLLLFN